MEIIKGMVVKSTAGHDGGSYYVVTAIDGGFAYIADGRERRLAKPKKKNVKHLQRTNGSVELSGLTDKKLKAALRSFNSAEQDIDKESDELV